MKKPLTRYIPHNAVAEHFEAVDAVVYRYGQDKPCAIAYSGKRRQADFHYHYLSEASREKAIANWIAGLRRTQKYKEERVAARKAFQPSLKVGDILVSSWGYDQTNVDYYEVVALKGTKSVMVREIASTLEATGFMCGKRLPQQGQYISEPLLRRISEGNVIRIDSASLACPWKGEANYCSWYA